MTCFLGSLGFWSLIYKGPQTFGNTFWTFLVPKVFLLVFIISVLCILQLQLLPSVVLLFTFSGDSCILHYYNSSGCLFSWWSYRFSQFWFGRAQFLSAVSFLSFSKPLFPLYWPLYFQCSFSCRWDYFWVCIFFGFNMGVSTMGCCFYELAW